MVLATGESINSITDNQWDDIKSCDSVALNNFFYHPWFVPNMLAVELKKYDGPLAKERLTEKWAQWQHVKYIFPVNRAEYISSCLPAGAQIQTYKFTARGDHPKTNPNVKINAKFNPDDGNIYKSYDSSVTSLIHILYLMNYKNIIIYGATMRDSKYFWSSGDAKYGKVHHLFNKAHEHNDPNRPHNASHIKDYIIDFNDRHMLPAGRQIWVGDTNTALYPELEVWHV